jgi:hypothetical protein
MNTETQSFLDYIKVNNNIKDELILVVNVYEPSGHYIIFHIIK